MAKRISIRQQRKEAPEWVFNWRRVGKPALAKWLAVFVTAGVFALLATAIRIRVSTPVSWATPKATVIQVGDDAIGRALTQRAREEGPFPSRFLPSRWSGCEVLEAAVLDASRWTPPRYVPALRELPEEAPQPPRLATRGEPVLPKRRLSSARVPMPVPLVPAPVIYPISGIQPEDVPTDLPPLDGPVDATLTAETWRFLVRLDASGHVRDCVSMAGGDESGPSPMEKWLRRVTFNPEPGKPARWIAVGVGFTNQPANDGTDAH
jgi:hypothetical protein